MLSIPLITAFDPDDRAAVRTAFAEAAQLSFGQAWRAAPESGFCPGTVRLGWREARLWAFAELADDDIFNPVLADGEPSFLSGDCFEFFVRPAGEAAYAECQVTPGNARLQLRYEGRDQVDQVRRSLREGAADPLAGVRVQPPRFASRTFVEAAACRWEVLLGIEFQDLGSGGGMPAAIECSCGRYDYTRGAAAPVISSTSLHPVADFHRTQEWARMALVR